MNENQIKKITIIYKKVRIPLLNHKYTSAILLYHGVSEKLEKNCILLDKFKEHLDYLISHYQIIKLSELISRIQTRTIDQNCVAITFDDAYQNVFTCAYPELVKYNVPATIFVPVNYIGSYNAWDHDPNPDEYPLLKTITDQELKLMDPGLIDFGSHSLSHSIMYNLSDQELVNEICESRSILENKLQREIKYFSYPYGQLTDFDMRSINYLKQYGYVAACTTHFSRFNNDRDLYTLKRIVIWDTDEITDVQSKLLGDYDWLYTKDIFVSLLSKIGFKE